MNRYLPLFLLAAGLSAQTAIFPSDYTAVADGPYSSPYLPLANGTSRALILYDQADIGVPVGASITKLGFREDGSTTTTQQGRALQLEVRMGWSTLGPNSMSTTFDSNFDGTPVTVFGPAIYQMPNLHDAADPLPNGRITITLTTPFVYAPAGRNLLVEYRIYGNSSGGVAFTYYLDRADYYSPVVTGSPGCPHSGGNVTGLAASPVRTGAAVYLNGTNGPANSFAVVAVNVGSPLVPAYPLTGIFGGIQPSCTGQLAPGSIATIGVATSYNGSFNPYYSVPNNPLLNDLWLSHQAIVLDVFSPGSIVTSNGVAVQVGVPPRATVLSAQGLPSITTTGTVNANYCPVTFFTWQ